MARLLATDRGTTVRVAPLLAPAVDHPLVNSLEDGIRFLLLCEQLENTCVMAGCNGHTYYLGSVSCCLHGND